MYCHFSQPYNQQLYTTLLSSFQRRLSSIVRFSGFQGVKAQQPRLTEIINLKKVTFIEFPFILINNLKSVGCRTFFFTQNIHFVSFCGQSCHHLELQHSPPPAMFLGRTTLLTLGIQGRFP